MVCGPTAGGKSELSDDVAERLTRAQGRHVPTLAVDSMQVYRELPVLTNQARRRPAELVGIVSVTEEWTVARHRTRAAEIIAPEATFVLDAGTGMYLNAILLDIPLAPRVSAEHRRLAREAAEGESNPRRAARAKELELAGVRDVGSIWEGRPRYDATTILYLRPERPALDAAISRRTAKITGEGLDEAELIRRMLAEGAPVSPSVRESVGARELTGYLSGDLSLKEAEDRIKARTRQLARRQMRWFDKLARTLEGRAGVRIVRGTSPQELLHGMHDIIGT